MAFIDYFRAAPGSSSESGSMSAVSVALSLLLAGCASLPAKAPEYSVRVMTYNIEYGHQGLDSVAAVIRDQHPDIVGLQEVDVHWSARSNFADQAALLARGAGMNYRFARIYQVPNADPSKPPREFGVALLSRYPIVSFVNREITRHSTQDTAAAPAPMPGLLDARVNVNGRTIRVLNVHLDYRADPSIRAKQVSEILDYIGTDTTATLLTGDMNAGPEAGELTLLRRRLSDVWRAPMNPGLTYSVDKPEKRIDYIMVSEGFCAGEPRVVVAHASDHFPVVVDLLVEPKCGNINVVP